MNLITLKKSTVDEKEILDTIFKESKPHFNKVEGRDPLAPLININEVIPEIPNDACQCLTIYYLDKIIGYLWVFNDSSSSFYILHFYISEKFRNLGFGSLAITELEKQYNEKQLTSAELVVSVSNVIGLRFWKSVGFDKIVAVCEPDQIGSNSVELELQKQIFFNKSESIHLLPVDERNSFLGDKLFVTSNQIEANLVLSVPTAIKEANKHKWAKPYFICLDNKVIGYTALVFDETIPKKESQHWLWQFTIDQHYQNKGYGSKALELILDHFRENKVSVITLSTKPTNHHALHLYKKFGFVSTGEINDDEIVLKKYVT